METADKLRALAEDIHSAKLGERGREAHVNSHIVIDEYHIWRAESEDFFNKYFDREEPLYNRFLSLSDEGNGYTLMHSFDIQYPIFNVLMKKVLAGSLQNQEKTIPEPRIRALNNTVFISHASKDKEISDAFVDLILHGALSVPIDQIFCTSTDGTKIKSGEDWRDQIKDSLLCARINFLIITPNYKESEVCLNEMGAGWVTSAKVCPLIVEPINYKTVGIIQEPIQVEKLLDETSLDRIRDEVQALLEIAPALIKSDRWTTKKHEFIRRVSKHLKETPFEAPLDRDAFLQALTDKESLKVQVLQLNDKVNSLEQMIEEIGNVKDKVEVLSIVNSKGHFTQFQEFQDKCKLVEKALSGNEGIINGIIYKTYAGKGIDISVENSKKEVDKAYANDYITEDLDADWSTTKKMRLIKEAIDQVSTFIGRDLSDDFYNSFDESYESALDLKNIAFWEECFNVSISFD